MKNYEVIRKIVSEMEGDVNKFNNGTNAAGSRIRKHCQEIKKACQALRTDVQEMKASRKK